MKMIELISVPSLLTIQDSGRKGYRKLGVPTSGYMDDYSARIANYLVGNSGDAPLLEFLLMGPTIRFNASAVFAIAGDVEVRLNGVPVEPWTSHWAKRGDILEVGALRSGLYGYIAFAGGIKCKPLLGSCSTYAKAGLGRPLKAGDVLNLGYAILTGREGKRLPEELRPDYSAQEITVGVILGPDLEHFTEEGVSTFLSEAYTVTPESDRMGYRLDGKTIEHSEKGAGIVTSPLVPGSVQVPPQRKANRDDARRPDHRRLLQNRGRDKRTPPQTCPAQARFQGALQGSQRRRSQERTAEERENARGDKAPP